MCKPAGTGAERIAARTADYIRRQYRNPLLKVQDIAGELHFSAAYVSRLFRQEMNKKLWDYVTELRMEEAKHLLASTDMKRYEIAYAVGYESPEHFSRMFKRYEGVSPSNYRKSAFLPDRPDVIANIERTLPK
ncbi:helix-turn-helix transcriptional regulator [Paenibacillus sp. S150]|uniref:helix-turn-helix transcriptional regulator n=1 Tax=Paenibacillus sp. S150 TaxID=2749826 RepID=UPI001C58EC3C|nr:AraC family transcriptional regulator [Paenibacillus sp. S150]MBW4084151.1 helix-turn-helix transcriptional regulator [Paenibacillus sp. S150]